MQDMCRPDIMIVYDCKVLLGVAFNLTVQMCVMRYLEKSGISI